MLSEISGNFGLNILINFIASNYFNDSFGTCIVFENGSFNDIYLTSELPNIVISKENTNGFEQDLSFPMRIEYGVNSGCKSWILENFVIPTFLDTYENITSTTGKQRPIRPKFLIYGFPEIQYQDNGVLLSILDHPLMKNVPDVLLILPSVDEAFDFDLLTAKFIGRLNSSAPVLIESARINSLARVGGGSGTEESAITFKFGRRKQELYNRGKVFNLHDRHLALAAFNYRPYTTVTEVLEGTGNANSRELFREHGDTFPQGTLQVDGSEGRMMLEFCKHYNCTLLIVEEDGNDWGQVYGNYTGNGLHGRVADKQAEVAVGGLYIWFPDVLEYSVPISRGGLTALVPKPKLMEAALIALLPFSVPVWIAVVVSYSVITVVNFLVDRTLADILVHLVNNTERNRRLRRPTFLNSNFFVFQIFVEQSVAYRSSLLFTKGFLVAIILLEGFVIGSVFAGSLLSFLAVPRYERPIDTPSDLAQSHLHWSATHPAWIFSIKDTEHPVFMTLRDNFDVHTAEELEELNTKATVGYAIERVEYGHIVFGEYVSTRTLELMRPMRHNIVNGTVVAALSRSWYLKDEFDEFILRIGQSGMQRYWLLDIVYRQLDFSVQLAWKVSNLRDADKTDAGAAQLRIDRMVGIFYMLAFGLALALLIFIVELFHCKYAGVG